MVGAGDKTNIWKTEDVFTGDGELDLEDEHKHVQQLLSNSPANDENKKLCLEIAKEYAAMNDFGKARKYLEGNYLRAESGNTEELKEILATLREQRQDQANESLNRCPSQEIKEETENVLPPQSQSGASTALDESFISCEEEENKEIANPPKLANGACSSSDNETVRRLQETIQELQEKLKKYETKEKTPLKSASNSTSNGQRRSDENEVSDESEVEEVGKDDSDSDGEAHSRNVTYISFVMNSEYEKWNYQRRMRELYGSGNGQFTRERYSYAEPSASESGNRQGQRNGCDPDVVTVPPGRTARPSAATVQDHNSNNGNLTSSTGWKYVDPERSTGTDKKSKIDLGEDSECSCCCCSLLYVLNCL